MSKGKCGRAGCDSPVWAKELCKKHYMEQRSAALKQQTCKNDKCDNPRGPTGGYCTACYVRFKTYGDPNAGPPRRKRRTEGPRTGKRSAYHANHAMVRKARGPAWKHQCEHCSGRAQTWATKRGASGESVADYLALCWSCHAKYDNFVARLPSHVGSKRSAETRRRLSEAALRRWEDPEYRAMMSEAGRRREARRRAARIADSRAPLTLF